MWTVQSAAEFIQEIHPAAFEAGWNLHLGGGVLTRGSSENDADIVALPRYQVAVHDKESFIQYLISSGWAGLKRTTLPNRDVHGLVLSLGYWNPSWTGWFLFVYLED